MLPGLTTTGVISPSKFAIFLLRNVVQSTVSPPSTLPGLCCILGVHSATGNPVQTYATVAWDTTGNFGAETDGAIASHEIGEWMDDPLDTNLTPAWGNIGQVTGRQYNLEVGDPLTSTIMPTINLNGKAYHMQELAFFSWFFDRLGTGVPGCGRQVFGQRHVCRAIEDVPARWHQLIAEGGRRRRTDRRPIFHWRQDSWGLVCRWNGPDPPGFRFPAAPRRCHQLFQRTDFRAL